MYSLNKAMIIGNITRDPEVRTTPSGQMVASFSVATNYSWTDQTGQKQEKAEYHNVVAWRKLAEICGQYLHKGKKVYIEGRIQTRDWEGQDGVKRNRTEIVADSMIMLSAPQGAGQRQSIPAPQSQFQPQPQVAPQEPIFTNEPTLEPIQENAPATPKSDEGEISVEDIPF